MRRGTGRRLFPKGWVTWVRGQPVSQSGSRGIDVSHSPVRRPPRSGFSSPEARGADDEALVLAAREWAKGNLPTRLARAAEHDPT